MVLCQTQWHFKGKHFQTHQPARFLLAAILAQIAGSVTVGGAESDAEEQTFHTNAKPTKADCELLGLVVHL